MKKKIFGFLTCVWVVCCLITYFTRIKSVVHSAIDIWTGAIIPSVFPYIILTKYLCNSNMLDIFELFPGKLITKIFKLSNCSIKPFICSLFCGYPSGAICASDLYKQNKIEKEEAQRLICFTNNAGPLYVISAIGGLMLGSIYKGIAIYIIQLMSALVYGYICSRRQKNTFKKERIKTSVNPDLCESVKESVNITVNICGFMIATFVLSECTKIFFEMILSDNFDTKYINTISDGFYEISAGVANISKYKYSSLTFGIICSFVSWSGISVIMQIKSVSGDIISVKRIINAKFFQSVFSFVFGYVFDCFSTQRSYTFKNSGTKASLICSVIIFCCYIFSKKKKLSE